MMKNSKHPALSPKTLDPMLIRLALKNAMKNPLAHTATAAVYAVPPGWETDLLKVEGAIATAHGSAELEACVQRGEKTIFIPKGTPLSPAAIARQLDRLYADVAVFMED